MQRDEWNNTQAITRVDGQNNIINNDTTEKKHRYNGKRQQYCIRSNTRRAQTRGKYKLGDINIVSETKLSYRQMTETEEADDIRTNEQYNLCQGQQRKYS